MPFNDTLAITGRCFAVLIIAKVILYVAVGRRLIRVLGRHRIRIFWQHYARGDHLLAAAWRMGTFLSLMISYCGLVFYSSWKSLAAPPDPRSGVFWLWLVLLIILLIRISIQILAEWIDLDQSLKALLTTLKIKSGLRTVGHVVSVLSLAYPVFSFQGWTALAVCSKRALVVGKGAKLFEKWFDRQVHGELRQFILAAIGAAIIETILKIVIIVAAIIQASP